MVIFTNTGKISVVKSSVSQSPAIKAQDYTSAFIWIRVTFIGHHSQFTNLKTDEQSEEKVL